MSRFKTFDMRQDDRSVVYVTLNLPQMCHALTQEMIAELADFAQTIEAAQTRAVVLDGQSVLRRR